MNGLFILALSLYLYFNPKFEMKQILIRPKSCASYRIVYSNISGVTTIYGTIADGAALLGVIITNTQSNKKIEQKLQTAQAVTDCKLEELTREVREHNNFAKRMPVVEEQIKSIQDKIHYFHVQEKAGE